MREEQVTKAILKKLLDNHWEIVCFDFPQSGTGRFLHPNKSTSSKNKGTINPDIVAVKNDICLFFENKDRYFFPDFEKQHSLIVDNQYTEAINNLLCNYEISHIYYGIGIPHSKYKKNVLDAQSLVDFLVCVSDDTLSVDFHYSAHSIHF